MQTQTVTTETIRKERAPGGDIPENVMMYFAANPDRFADRQTFDRDVERIMKMSKTGIEKADAEPLAWLLWRARMVRSWSRNPTTRQFTLSWEEAVEHAWLKDELFQLCSDRRKAFYAEQEARRERLSNFIQTGIDE